MSDFSYALRQLLRHRGFALAAVFTLGLGISLVATQFSLIDGLFLRGMPFPNADRLVHVSRTAEAGSGSWWTQDIDIFRAQVEQQQSFEALGAISFGNYNMVAQGDLPKRLQGAAVTDGYFQALGTAPALGRALRAADNQPGQPLRALLSDQLWREDFAADPGVLGRSLRLNGEIAEVVGVMPPGFEFPGRDRIWVNLRLPPAGEVDAAGLRVEAVGLLRPDVDREAAASELALIAERQRQRNGDNDEQPYGVNVQSVQIAYNGGGTIALFAIMQAMTLFVLLLACTNVANLVFVRTNDRLRELAVRSALGACRAQVIRQLLIESLLLGALGAAVGAALAALGIHLMSEQIAATILLPNWIQFDLSYRVLGVTVLVACFSGLLAGLIPAARIARRNLSPMLTANARSTLGGRAGGFGRWLVAAQLAFACAALVVAVMLALSAVRSSALTRDYEPESLLIGRIELEGATYADPGDRARFYNELVERVAQVPGVQAAAVSSRDLANPGVGTRVEIEGQSYQRDQDRPRSLLEVVSRDYFSVVERGAISGRLFSTEDRADGNPVALVNRSFAEQHWPGENPIGKRLRRFDEDSAWATVIGVVPDLHMQGVGQTGSGAGWYQLQDQLGWGWLDLIVRTRGDHQSITQGVRAAVAEVDPGQPIHSIANLVERTERSLAGPRIIGAMAAVFAVVALFLASIGVYGVMAYAARLRVRELGLRLALGSSGRGVIGLMLRQNALQTAVGIGIGLALGFLLAQPLSAEILAEVSATDPWLYLGVATTLSLAALLACWIPALRASQTDPMAALRSE